MNLEEMHRAKINNNLLKLKDRRPYWNRMKLPILAERLAVDGVTWADIDKIDKKFFDDFQEIKGAVVITVVHDKQGNATGEEPQKVRNDVINAGIDAYNAYLVLYGEDVKYKKESIFDVSVKECMNLAEKRGKRYVGFVLEDGRKFRMWL